MSETKDNGIGETPEPATSPEQAGVGGAGASTAGAPETPGAKPGGPGGKGTPKSINEAIKQVESFTENLGKALGSALQDRANVVMVRVNDDSLSYLDMLIEADITKSRSESAAFLINEGIKSNEALFNKIREITDQIAALRAQLRHTVRVEDED